MRLAHGRLVGCQSWLIPLHAGNSREESGLSSWGRKPSGFEYVWLGIGQSHPELGWETCKLPCPLAARLGSVSDAYLEPKDPRPCCEWTGKVLIFW